MLSPEHNGLADVHCSVSDFTRSEEGAKTQKRLWDELVHKLESIQPGIMENI